MTGGGQLEILDAQFIRIDQFNIYNPELSFRLAEKTTSFWTTLQVEFNIAGFCKGEVRQWSFPVDLIASKTLYHIRIDTLTNKLQFCRSEIITAQIAGPGVQVPKFTLEELTSHQKSREAKEAEQKRLAAEAEAQAEREATEKQVKMDAAALKAFTDSIKLTFPHLPPHFAGNDIVQIFRAHEALRTAEKSEYETSVQFKKRIDAAESLFFSRTAFAFVVPVVSEYDADEQVLNVGVECSPQYEASRAHVLRSIRVKRQVSTKDYTASNAFGAKLNVHETDVESFDIGVNNGGDFAIDAKSLILSPIRVTPGEARQIKLTLSAVVVCNINRDDDQITVKDAILRRATFDDPQEYFEQLHFLNARVQAIWFFDSVSGKVYSKVQ